LSDSKKLTEKIENNEVEVSIKYNDIFQAIHYLTQKDLQEIVLKKIFIICFNPINYELCPENLRDTSR